MMAMAARSRRPLMSGTSLYPPPCFFGTLICRVMGMESSSRRNCSGFHDRRDANLPAEFRPLNEHRRVFGDDLLDDEPVEKAAQRRQVLLDGRRGQRLGLDIGGDMQRPDRGELQTVFFTPAAELGNGLYIGRARILVADRGGEEFEEMLAGFVARSGDDRRHRKIR